MPQNLLVLFLFNYLCRRLNKMINYSIKDLAEISGIKAHTIRIWEQRYNLLTPARTDTNIRLYGDEDLKKLLNVAELINRGRKISHIANMTNAQIINEIDEIIGLSTSKNLPYETIINQMVIAISTFDEVLFDKVFSDSVTRWSLTETYNNVIYPMLVKTGLMWSKSELMPAQEHFLSNLIRQKLFSVIDYLPLPGNPEQTWILFLNEGEEHEIGLLFANFVLRQCKQKVIYLGTNVPYENLKSVVEQINPSHLYTFFVKNQPAEKIRLYMEKIKNDFKYVHICISGRADLIGKNAHDNRFSYIEDIQQLLQKAQNK